MLRFPPQGKQSSLQAWDAADEYLLKQLHEKGDLQPRRMAILNDDFGALSCALADYSPDVFSDSFMAHKAISLNCVRNQLPAANVASSMALAQMSNAETAYDLVLIKVPRTLALLEQQLIDLRPLLTTNTRIIAAGKVTSITSNVLKLFEKTIGETRTSLAVKKARLIYAQFNPALNCHNHFPSIVLDAAIDFTLFNHANVFCRDQLDIGARLLLDHLPTHFNGHCIDLGCGNGVLGVALLKRNLEASVTFVDESFMAIASATQTAQSALDAQKFKDNTTFEVSHCLQTLLDKQAPKVDLVLCNPPFHQQNVITDEIAGQMFVDAKRMLKPGGELRVVANRHLHYTDKLKRLFGACKLVASNQKFVVLSAMKTNEI